MQKMQEPWPFIDDGDGCWGSDSADWAWDVAADDAIAAAWDAVAEKGFVGAEDEAVAGCTAPVGDLSGAAAVKAADDSKDVRRYCINTDRCIRCGDCMRACSSRAIAAGPTGQSLRILYDRCIACGSCYQICPTGAVQAV